MDDASFQNPFRARSSELQRDHYAFLRNYGVGVIDLLPETVWDRPLVIRSAPGGGKTSLMRLFTLESLQLIHQRQGSLEALHEKLTEVGALSPFGPTRLGIYLALGRDYKLLSDIGLGEEAAIRLFFRLLDARISVEVLRAALLASGGTFPIDVDRVRLVPTTDANQVDDSLNRLGGQSGKAILDTAVAVESAVLDILDSLLPVRPDELARGHFDLYSLRVLSACRIEIDGQALPLKPVVLFDDGHELASIQRASLLDRILDRNLQVAAWYSERFEALSTQELLQGDVEGRDYELLEIEAAARGAGPRPRKVVRFDRFLQDVGNRRAAPTLMRYGETSGSFVEELEIDPETLLGDKGDQVLADLQRVARDLGNVPRYSAWLDEAPTDPTYASALRWRELMILIGRDRDRSALELFDFALEEQDADRLSGSSVREAARLFLAREYKLPYYCGPDAVGKLGAQNVEQYLSVAGDLFEQMLAAMTLSKPPHLRATQQDLVIRRASERYWRTIPRRLPFGRDVQRLLISIVSLSRRETYRPNAPYAPGVTGTALTMSDREDLLDPKKRFKIPGGDRLFDALGAAIAYNVLSAELDRPSKGDRVMVLYLNRLLCPRFDLPLGRGGFRERGVAPMAGWMLRPDIDQTDGVELDLGLVE